MVKLRELLASLPADLFLSPTWSSLPYPNLDQEVTGVTTNSWACQPGVIFIGMPGTRVDGGQFWQSALDAGAIAALVSARFETPDPATACVIPMVDMTRTCAEIANQFFQHPSRQMQMVGVTGTNGKTTTTHLIEYLLSAAKNPTALLGTLYARWPGCQETATHTTPFPVDLQQQLKRAADAGCRYGVMEVSSHALDQGRVLGCEFAVAVFTNLTQDHLDYHPTMDDYFAAKARLFSPPYLQGKAIINQDDAYGHQLIQRLDRSQIWTYSTSDPSADLATQELRYGASGVEGTLKTPMGAIAFSCPLVGQFNVENLLAAVGAALTLGVSLETIAAALPGFSGVPGRMQQVRIAPDQPMSVIVDYAHTPDSLENLLMASRPFVAGQLICVFGCGGDRDRTKRPLMGEIAARLADQVYVTSDNPRTEDPQQILKDVVAGIPPGVTPVVEVDRQKAIHQAIAQAQPGDAVLIAGKGHEDYQILGTEKIHFDDREVAQAALSDRLQSFGIFAREKA
jgi:UDP-N-acetylmuramoyl-L-alanyl-D-glutamate--2,6-diaminopimelate ligase